MDSLPSSQVSPEQTRESLIAISQTVPEKVPTKPKLDSRTDASVTDKTKTPGEEEYRSKLISVSYTPSPDSKITTPESPAVVDG